mmetsp:Transcript_31556/g.62414  ORF Transcript_31556/g.62414 Transcript_31556/m.62414 type:complete len:146 (-) Transcript_31556:864-1301(-)
MNVLCVKLTSLMLSSLLHACLVRVFVSMHSMERSERSFVPFELSTALSVSGKETKEKRMALSCFVISIRPPVCLFVDLSTYVWVPGRKPTHVSLPSGKLCMRAEREGRSREGGHTCTEYTGRQGQTWKTCSVRDRSYILFPYFSV